MRNALSWVFEGTGLGNGDTFGADVTGSEMDTARFEAVAVTDPTHGATVTVYEDHRVQTNGAECGSPIQPGPASGRGGR